MSLRSIYISVRWKLAISLICWLGVLASAQAQTVIERLVSPGPLTKAHEKYEKTCNQCHTAFDKSAQASLCLDCHKDVAQDFQRAMGFHGKAPDTQNTPCKACHTEHEGVAFDISEFDQKTFDHAFTDYALKGGHKNVDCAQCHSAEKKFRDAPVDCIACHKSDDPHKGQLGDDCQSCHNVNDWLQVDFDHGKTDFPLFGKHRSVKCAACHIDNVYEDLPAKCIDCHQKDDSHNGKFGADCESCHDASSWATTVFNHRRETGFALSGGHAKIECAACHTNTLFQPKLMQDCVSCHKKDDTHKGRNGTECADCHVDASWQATTFNHNRNTKFALRGAHAKVACETCHLGPVATDRPGDTCVDCHQSDDPHEGGQGENCSACHNEVSWVENTRFDHDLSKFPLLGKHDDVECAACHQSKKFQDAETECIACHAEDDKHAGALGGNCGLCHNPNSWALWRFDHNTQTDFKLEGAHENLTCSSCHRTSANDAASQSAACIACHRADDKHRGQYGANCKRCHTTSTFKSIKFP